MKMAGKTSVILAVAIVVVLGLLTGCEEQNLSDTRKSRLVAAENMQLKKDLAQRDEEIEKQKGLLAECIEEQEMAAKQVQKSLKELSDTALKDFEEIISLKQENSELRAQLDQLQKRPAESQQ